MHPTGTTLGVLLISKYNSLLVCQVVTRKILRPLTVSSIHVWKTIVSDAFYSWNEFDSSLLVLKTDQNAVTPPVLLYLCFSFVCLFIYFYFGFSAPIKPSFPFVSFAEYVTDSYVCLGRRSSEHRFFEKQLSLPWKTEVFKNVLPEFWKYLYL